MKYRVLVRLKGGVLDVQGKAIENGLRDKKYEAFRNVRVGRVIEFDMEGISEQQARAQVREVCSLLFANPVIEECEVQEVA